MGCLGGTVSSSMGDLGEAGGTALEKVIIFSLKLVWYSLLEIKKA